ncbi:hypothetical protein D3C86_1323940 [compost metagenome]
MTGLRCEWAHQRQNVRCLEQFLARDIFHAQRLAIGIWPEIVADETAAETGHNARENRPNLPRTHNADGLAVKIEAKQPIKGEVSFTDTVIGAVNLAVERQDERHGVFGNRIGRIGRDARNGQAELFGGGEVDLIETGAT